MDWKKYLTGQNTVLLKKRWKSLFYRNKDSISRLLAGSLDKLLEHPEYHEIKNGVICIFYIRTGIYTQQPFYRIYFFDENGYHGALEHWVFWEIPIINDYLKWSWPTGNSQIPLTGKQMIQIEKERAICIEFFHETIAEMIEEIFSDVLKLMRHFIECPVYFGEFMDENRLIYLPMADGKVQGDCGYAKHRL